jgi:hypothetical protein
MSSSSPSDAGSASPRSERRWKIFTAALTAIGLVLAGVAIYYARSSNRYAGDANRLAHLQFEVQQAQEAAKRLQTAASNIQFDKPTGSIPRCAKFTGRAEIIPDQVLWIAHRD